MTITSAYNDKHSFVTLPDLHTNAIQKCNALFMNSRNRRSKSKKNENQTKPDINLNNW
jgi:hypothetical protein